MNSFFERYINKVIIQDLQTRHVWHFFCNCWLSADREDGMTKKTFNAAKNNEIASFRSDFDLFTTLELSNSEKVVLLIIVIMDFCFSSVRNIFQTRTSTGFRDEHIWMSIVSPPSRSPFTRAQRVSCCMSLLLCTMAINIAFWNIPLDPNSQIIFALGKLQRLWQ